MSTRHRRSLERTHDEAALRQMRRGGGHRQRASRAGESSTEFRLSALRGRADRCGLGGLGKGPGPHSDEPSGEEPEKLRQSERLLVLALKVGILSVFHMLQWGSWALAMKEPGAAAPDGSRAVSLGLGESARPGPGSRKQEEGAAGSGHGRHAKRFGRLVGYDGSSSPCLEESKHLVVENSIRR